MAIIEAIETVYLEANTTYINLTSLGTYEHLQIRYSARSASTSSNYYDSMNIRFATGGGAIDTGTNYSIQQMYATGSSSVGAGAATGQTAIYVAGMGDTTASPQPNYGANIIDILDYRNANKNTSIQTYFATGAKGVGTTYTIFASGMWDNTGAVDKIELGFYSSSSILRGTELTLYGIKSS
jgi:hypothetical protein